MLSTYVDDTIIIGDNFNEIIALKSELARCFVIEDLNFPCYFLSIKVVSSPKGYLLFWYKL